MKRFAVLAQTKGSRLLGWRICFLLCQPNGLDATYEEVCDSWFEAQGAGQGELKEKIEELLGEGADAKTLLRAFQLPDGALAWADCLSLAFFCSGGAWERSPGKNVFVLSVARALIGAGADPERRLPAPNIWDPRNPKSLLEACSGETLAALQRLKAEKEARSIEEALREAQSEPAEEGAKRL